MFSASKIPYIAITLTFLVGFALAWLITFFLFDQATRGGAIYHDSLSMDQTPYSNNRVIIQGSEEYYDRFWMNKEGLYRYDIYIGGTTALVIYIGKVDDVEEHATKAHLASCDLGVTPGYAIYWSYSGTASRTLRELYGKSSTEGCRVIVGYSDEYALMPYARDVNLAIPKGAINPLIMLLLDQGTKGLKTSMDSKISKAMNVQLSYEIASKLRLEDLNKKIAEISFLYGPIQFSTVFLLFFCLVVLLASIFQPWALKVTEGMLDLVPYVGFFGTLLGMGAALGILGNANLSDPISKAISLGPIGSKLALAIETTKFALVCFAIGTFFLVLRSAFKSSKIVK